MNQFKIKSEGFKEIKSKTLKWLIPFCILIVGMGIGIGFFVNNKKDHETNIIAIPIYVVFISVALGIGIIRGLRRRKKILDSYTLTIDNNTITRYQDNTPTIQLYHSEIKEIYKTSNHAIIIKGQNPVEIILVPPQIENIALLEKLLQDIKPISVNPTLPLLEKFRWLPTFLSLGLMAVVYTVKDKIVVTLCGVPLLALMIWSLYETQKNKSIDSKSRRASWLVIIAIASVIAVIILNWIGVKKK